MAACALGGFAVSRLRPPAPAEDSWPWWLLVAAALLGGYALRRMDRWPPDEEPAVRPAESSDRRRRRWGLACLVVATLLTTSTLVRLWPDPHRWQGTVIPWLVGMALLIVGSALLGAVGEPAGPSSRRDVASPSLPRWLEASAFALVAALAVFLRVHRLGQIPAGIYVDETNGALDALYILEGREISPFVTGWYETPSLYLYYMAGLFHLFGANHAALKAASLLPAIASVLALYPLGRLLFGPLAGLAAMLLMAVSRWHLTMSRWGWNETAPPLFQILATWLLIRGLRSGRALDFALAGLIAGLMTYTYLSSRLALATMALFALWWLFRDPEGIRAAFRRHGKGLLLFALTALLAAAPLAVSYVKEPFTFWNRMRELSIFNEVRNTSSYAPLVDNTLRHLKSFHQEGDRHGKHNLPGEPHLDPVTGVLFVIGLGHGLLRIGDRRRGLLWIWVVVAMAGGVFSVRHEAPQAYRTLNAVPAVALIGGDVLVRLGRGLRRAAPSVNPWAAAFGPAILLAAAAIGNVRVYFGPQADSPAVQSSFNLMENFVARDVLAALEKGTEVYLSPRLYEFSPLRFLVYGVVKKKKGANTLDDRPFHLIRPELDLPVPGGRSDALLLLDSFYWNVMDHLRQFYPEARPILVRGPEGGPLYVRVDVGRDQLAAVQGLRARFTHEGGRVEESIKPSIAIESPASLVSAEWTGAVRVAWSGEHDFNPGGAVRLTLDGQEWKGPRFLGRGLHDLRVVWQAPDGLPFRLSWKTPRGDTETVPPEAFFRVGPPPLGLMARYYQNPRWEGEPVFLQRAPFILTAWNDGDPWPGPFSASFTGRLRIENPGHYGFRVEADDGARLVLDGVTVAEGLIPDRPNTLRAEVELTAGDHPIRIDYFQNGGGSALEFYWQPPGEEEVPVPPRALIPE